MSSAAKSSMRLFLLLCLLAASLSSCAPRLMITESRELSVNSGDMSMTVEPGSDLETMDSSIGQYDFVLKAGSNEISGFLVARNVFDNLSGPEDRGVRVVASTYLGMRLFDITVTRSAYRMNGGAEFLSDRRVAAFLASALRKKYFQQP